jgi:hypothetical protein
MKLLQIIELIKRVMYYLEWCADDEGRALYKQLKEALGDY